MPHQVTQSRKLLTSIQVIVLARILDLDMCYCIMTPVKEVEEGSTMTMEH